MFHLLDFDCLSGMFVEQGTDVTGGSILIPHRGGCASTTTSLRPIPEIPRDLTIKDYLDYLQAEYQFNNRDYTRICVYLYGVHGIMQTHQITEYSENLILEQIANIEQGEGVQMDGLRVVSSKNNNKPEKIILEEEKW